MQIRSITEVNESQVAVDTSLDEVENNEIIDEYYSLPNISR